MIKKTQAPIQTLPTQSVQGPALQQQSGPSIQQQSGPSANQSLPTGLNDLQQKLQTNQFEVGGNTAQQVTPQISQEGGTIAPSSSQSLLSLQIAEATDMQAQELATPTQQMQTSDKMSAMQAMYDAEIASSNKMSAMQEMYDAGLSANKMAEMQAMEQGNITAYQNSPFNYSDAESLAQFWGTSVQDAKGTIGYKMQTGWEDQVHSALKMAGMQQLEGPQDGADLMQANFDAYVNSQYNYDDAANLAQMWEVSVPDAKQMIGQKVQNGQGDSVDWALVQSERNQIRYGSAGQDKMITGREDWSNLQNFFKAGLEYEDAQVLASHWQMPVNEAKDLAGYKLSIGQADIVNGLIGR